MRPGKRESPLRLEGDATDTRKHGAKGKTWQARIGGVKKSKSTGLQQVGAYTHARKGRPRRKRGENERELRPKEKSRT